MRAHLMPMNHEYDDDRPTDRAGEVDNGEQVPPGAFADDFAFEAPDLATAFLAALDAVDDRRFVGPPLDDLLPGNDLTPPAAAEALSTEAQIAAEAPIPAEAPIAADAPFVHDLPFADALGEAFDAVPEAAPVEPEATAVEEPPPFETPETMAIRIDQLELGTLRL